ncbi:MAG: ABC transporter ATP-binding protein [Deltaproteobacteria bacterium]|nr:ABC transporter ATP-binding protein [Deltaproteobacteria bacterium]
MTGALIRARGVGHAYGTTPVFKNVDLDVGAGQILLLMGPNGAGKSTLLKIMAGIVEATLGEIELLTSPERVAFMGHGTFVYEELTALENLSFWRDLYQTGHDRGALRDILERMGLERFRHERAGTFSRGMLQKLGLARILLIGPELVLLDEPATGLDRTARRLLHDEVAAAAGRGAGVVWVSHDPDRDVSMADTVAYLSGGRLSWSGPAGQFEAGRMSA